MSRCDAIIAVDVLSARSGGGAVYARNQLRALASQRPEWHLVVLCVPQNISEIAFTPADGNVDFLVVPRAGPSLTHRLIWQFARLPKLVESIKADVLYSPGNFIFPRVPVAQVLTLQNPNHFSPISSQRTLALKLKRFLQRRASVWSIRRAAAVVFISQNYRARVEQIVNLDRLDWTVLYSGVDLRMHAEGDSADNAFSRGGVRPCDQYILMVSNLYRHKNLEVALRAFELIADERTDLKLVIIGDTADECYGAEIREVSAQLKHKDRIVFAGGVPHDLLAPWYARASCYLSTSLLEAFPLTPHEAMMAEVPTVLSALPVFREICGEAALYVDPCSVEDTAEKLCAVLSDSATASGLIRRGKEHASRFSWESNAAGLADVFETVLSASHRGRFPSS